MTPAAAFRLFEVPAKVLEPGTKKTAIVPLAPVPLLVVVNELVVAPAVRVIPNCESDPSVLARGPLTKS